MKSVIRLEGMSFQNPCEFQDTCIYIHTCSCCRPQPDLYSPNQDILYDSSPYKTKPDPWIWSLLSIWWMRSLFEGLSHHISDSRDGYSRFFSFWNRFIICQGSFWIGKRPSLREDSSLGTFTEEQPPIPHINQVDTKTVLGGTPFKIPVYMSYRGLSMKLNVLVDTGT